jgi:hypothetical protein
MDDKDFDKIFQRKLNDVPGIPASEANWMALSGRLDAHDGRRKRGLVPFLWLLVGLLSALHLWSGYQVYRFGHTQAERTSNTLTKRDTVIQTTVIYRYDTIYIQGAVSRFSTTPPNTVYSSFGRTTAAPGANLSAHPHDKDSGVRQTTVMATAPVITPDSTSTTARQALIAAETFAQPSAVANVQNNTSLAPISASGAANEPLANALSSRVAETDSTREYEPVPVAPLSPAKRLRRTLFKRPQLGINVGRGTPVIPEMESGALWQTGLTGNVEVLPGLRLEAGVQYQQSRMKSEVATAINHLVTVPNPGSDYTLEYWETYRLPMLTYSAQLRYQLGTWWRLMPYAGVGARVKTVLPFELEYEFEDGINQLELNEPGAERATTSWQGFTHLLGMEREMGKNYNFALEGIWLKNWGQPADIFSEQWSINARLMYRF